MVFLWYAINILNGLNIQESERITELERQSKENLRLNNMLRFAI